MLTEFQSATLAGSVQSPHQPLRILHIVESLDNQAVESWLLRVLRAASSDYPHIKWTFFTTQRGKGLFDETARGLGAEVIHSQYEMGEKIRFVRSLRQVMKRGRYDILHCHHDVVSAIYLLASKGLPFQKRIVHVHNTSLSLPTSSRIKANLAREPMRQMCFGMANEIVGISKAALESLLGDLAFDPRRHRVVHCSVDTASFGKVSTENAEFRKSLGITKTAKLLLFVGRMVEYKNPSFLVNTLEHMVEAPDAVVVFAGAGDQETAVRNLAVHNGLEHRVKLIGFRDDVPELMAAADILVWPSWEEPMEGLGLGIVEAQAAGLPVLMSRSVPEEAIVVPELVTVLPLAAGPQAWARQAIEILNRQHPARTESHERVEASSFSMKAGVANLMALYDDLETDRQTDPTGYLI